MLSLLNRLVRLNVYVYIFLRRRAVYLCRYFFLEDGFSFLGEIKVVDDAVAIDVGSNDGTSIAMINRVHPAHMICAFDPITSPKNHTKNLIYRQIALSDKEAELTLYVPTVKGFRLTQYTTVDRKSATSQICSDFGLNEVEISFKSLESLSKKLDSFNLNPYFLKIDVEGHERAVLEGSVKTIRQFNPIILVEIQSPTKYSEIEDFLNRLNYFNLKWPQKGKRRHFRLVGEYSLQNHNYIWLPRNNSITWNLRLKEL